MAPYNTNTDVIPWCDCKSLADWFIKMPQLRLLNRVNMFICHGRCKGFMVSLLSSKLTGSGSSPCQGHCAVLLGKTIFTHSVSSPRYILEILSILKGYR